MAKDKKPERRNVERPAGYKVLSEDDRAAMKKKASTLKEILAFDQKAREEKKEDDWLEMLLGDKK